MKPIRISLAGLLSLILAMLCGCEKPFPKAPLRVGVIEWTGFYGLMRGQVEGAFAEAGLSVEVIGYPDNPTMNAELAAGHLDACGMVWVDLIRMSAQGHKVRVATVLDWSDNGDVLLASNRVTQAADLKGKRISFEGVHSFSHLFVLGVLAKNNLQESDVHLLDLPAQQVPAAIAEGRIDAGHTWGPLAEAAVKDGGVVIDRAGDVPGWITEVLAVRTQVAETRSDELKRLLVVLDRMHPADPADAAGREAARKAAGLFLKKPAAELAPIGAEAHLVSLKEARLLMTDGQDPEGLITSGRKIAAFLSKRGQIPKDHDVSTLIDVSLVAP